ncbi:MAG: iron-sulfur cluster assembly scaffold protein [Legionella sp.]|nr:iron-sulfur cluster assembly scaffold protein [Legionella sp.]
MIYNELVENCFFEPKHVGMMDCHLKNTLCHQVGNVSQREYFDLYLSFDETGQILKACFKAYGNPYLIAGVEWVCRQLEGTLINEHPKFDYHFVVQKLAIPKSYYPIALLVGNGYHDIVHTVKEQLRKNDE